MPYLFPSGLPSRLPVRAGVPFAQYGAITFGASAKPQQYKIDVVATGAREIRVWQVNHGGKRHIKNILKESGSFKTHKRVKGKRADNPAILKFRVFWKKSAGGGSSWHGPIRFGTSKSWSLTRPAGLPVGEAGKDTSPAGGGGTTLADVTDAVTDVATSWTDTAGGGAGAGGGEGTSPASGLPSWLVPAGVGVAVGVPVLALVVKRLRKGSKPAASLETAPAEAVGQGPRRRHRRVR